MTSSYFKINTPRLYLEIPLQMKESEYPITASQALEQVTANAARGHVSILLRILPTVATMYMEILQSREW